MKKNCFLVLLFTVFFFCIPIYANASYDAIIDGSSVRIRDKATTDNSKILYTVNYNTSISVVDKTLIEGSGCDSKWYKITYKNKTGYVCSKYVRFVDNTYSGINVIDWTSRVNSNNVSVRQTPSTSAKSIDTLTLGANVKITGTTTSKNSGCDSNTWYQIKYYGNKTGYICSNYVTTKTDIMANDDAYAKTLKDAGFPDSYIPYLTYLHNKYPNWSFTPKILNKNFASAVSGEEGKNYMQTTNDNYRTSNKPAEGSSWFRVNSGVIAFYLDPRNWLNEERIFMFEKLDYDSSLESQYLDLVKAVFGSGKLADEKYTVPMVNAGKTNKISPVHIASRIVQEVSANGSDSTNGTEFTFKNKKYSGYYNFFNIGAYEQTIDNVKYSAITRGLAYAAKLIDSSDDRSVWNNIQTAITEGSRFLANGYVNKGQGTLYYQKFNVSPDAYYNSYTHQYMTNIQAPATEGNKSYNSYKKANLLNGLFIFEIPVYNNMPEYTSLPNSGDKDNNLKSLSIDGYYISPNFDKDVLTYEAWVPSSVNKIKVNATASSSKATTTGTGEIELVNDEADITITVTAETGDEKKYVISINRVNDSTPAEDVLKSANLNVNGNYIVKIKNKTTVSNFQNNLVKSGASNLVIRNSKGNTISGNDKVTTNSTLTITTSIETKTFTLVVNGDTSGDGEVTILDLLQIQKHIKGVKKLSSASLLAGDTSNDNNVTILDLLQVQKHIKGVKPL